jgi:putative transposase
MLALPAHILKENGIEPAPGRGKHIRSSIFLKAHWECLTATDFLSVEVCTLKGLVTYCILFFIDIASRSVHIASVRVQPNSA